ncbi:unnamed protein product [Prorocentrum cordatum]|uniref:Pre-mRNA-splicing factor 38 n=1 Tax=Prorocentrum cordatum TaxID=2364126 RepID=A0ABN9SZE9_9DINO|nr:unnamed protein product [Polarella glacialis]
MAADPNAMLQMLAGMRAQNEVAAQSLADQMRMLQQGQQGHPQLQAPPPQLQPQLLAQAQFPATASSASRPAVPPPPLPRLPPLPPELAALGAGGGSLGSRLPPLIPPLQAAAAAAEAPQPGVGAAGAGDAPADAAPEVPRCHLHRKASKACKFCRAFAEAQEKQSQRREELKSAARERLRAACSGGSGASLGPSDKAPLPNLANFPQVLQERIQRSDYYATYLASAEPPAVRSLLERCESCEVETRDRGALDMAPSPFICCVLRLMQIQLTEGQLQDMLDDPTVWTRCAAYSYVRWGMHHGRLRTPGSLCRVLLFGPPRHDRYWELLSEALLDDEEFTPFPGRGSDSMECGQYVEQLFTRDKYCDTSLPRIPVAQRKMLMKRLVLYEQFRKRYAANLAVRERYEHPGKPVEFCSVDGEWSVGETTGSLSSETRNVSVRVKLPGDGGETHVSLGMIISPLGRDDPKGAQSRDLTRSRGRSSHDLLERFDEKQRSDAVADGKDYCKSSGQHTVRVGGVPFIAGVKRKELEQQREEEPDWRQAAMREEQRAQDELKAKRAAIESKYLARVSSSQGKQARPRAVGRGVRRPRRPH